MEADTRCILDILPSHFYSKIECWQKNNKLCVQLMLCLFSERQREAFLTHMLLPLLLAHHFSPQLVSVAHTLLSLTACGERWKPGQALPQVTPIQVLGVPWLLNCMAGVPFSLAAAAPWSFHHAQSVLLILFSLLIFGPEVSFQNSSRAWK